MYLFILGNGYISLEYLVIEIDEFIGLSEVFNKSVDFVVNFFFDWEWWLVSVNNLRLKRG